MELNHPRLEEVFHPTAISGSTAAYQLRIRGYAATEDKLKKAVQEGAVTLPEGPSRNPKWTVEAIEQAADYLEKREDFSPEVLVCLQLRFSYGAYHQALRDAYEQAVDEFGSAATRVLLANYELNSDDFIMHVEPQDGEKDSHIWFTLRDNSRRKIERAKTKPAKQSSKQKALR